MSMRAKQWFKLWVKSIVLKQFRKNRTEKRTLSMDIELLEAQIQSEWFH